MSLQKDLRRLIDSSRGRGRLAPAPARDAIGIATSQGLPTSNQTTTGADNFLALSDTPAEYTDEAGSAIVVNQAADALEFGELIASPLTEQSRETTTVRICCETNSDYFIDIDVATQVTFLDSNGNTVVLNLTPDTTSNCP
jgi:hypothetical protein